MSGSEGDVDSDDGDGGGDGGRQSRHKKTSPGKGLGLLFCEILLFVGPAELWPFRNLFNAGPLHFESTRVGSVTK